VPPRSRRPFSLLLRFLVAILLVLGVASVWFATRGYSQSAAAPQIEWPNSTNDVAPAFPMRQLARNPVFDEQGWFSLYRPTTEELVRQEIRRTKSKRLYADSPLTLVPETGPGYGIAMLERQWIEIQEEVDGFSWYLPLVEREVFCLSALRNHFRFESLEDRLAYEEKNGSDFNIPESSARARELDPEVERRLGLYERWLTPSDAHGLQLAAPDASQNRRTLLALLHTHTNEQFVRTTDFGFRRSRGLRGIYKLLTPLPEYRPIPVTPRMAEPYEDHESAFLQVETEVVQQGQPYRDDLQTMHIAGWQDFVDPDRTGFVMGRDYVAGFQSHRFTNIPVVPERNADPRQQWQVVRLELISLLKHETPAAYMSENLPSMDELRNAPTRGLDAFEQQALERLRLDDDLLIEDTPERIRMVGSLRAARSCLDCHSVRRGELLGAFSYELVPVPRLRQTGAIASQPN